MEDSLARAGGDNMHRDGQTDRAHTHAEDYKKVQAILREDRGAWDWFLDMYVDRILWTSYVWCRSHCFKRPCPVKRTGMARLVDRVSGSDCDEISDGFTFILSTLRRKILPAFRGECSLSSFLFAVLESSGPGSKSSGSHRYDHRALHADFVRGMIGRIRLPKAVQAFPQEDQEVFVAMCRGWDDERIAMELDLERETVVELPDIRRRIEATLRSKDWDSYWRTLGYKQLHEVPLSPVKDEGAEEEEMETEVPDSSPGPERMAVIQEIRTIVRLTLGQLPTNERLILRMMLGKRLTAAQVAVALRLEERTAYYLCDIALSHLAAALTKLRPHSQDNNAVVLKKALKAYLGEIAGPEE